jgi:hypothetical protein
MSLSSLNDKSRFAVRMSRRPLGALRERYACPPYSKVDGMRFQRMNLALAANFLAL